MVGVAASLQFPWRHHSKAFRASFVLLMGVLGNVWVIGQGAFCLGPQCPWLGF